MRDLLLQLLFALNLDKVNDRYFTHELHFSFHVKVLAHEQLVHLKSAMRILVWNHYLNFAVDKLC
jgi:hypothetical protein